MTGIARKITRENHAGCVCPAARRASNPVVVAIAGLILGAVLFYVVMQILP